MDDEFSEFLKKERQKGLYKATLYIAIFLFVSMGFIIAVFSLLNLGVKHVIN